MGAQFLMQYCPTVLSGGWVNRFSVTSHALHVASAQVQSVHVQFQWEGLQNNHITLKRSNFFATLHQRLTWYWPFCIDYETDMMSHYIEEVCALK
jgi:hypothetical protein